MKPVTPEEVLALIQRCQEENEKNNGSFRDYASLVDSETRALTQRLKAMKPEAVREITDRVKHADFEGQCVGSIICCLCSKPAMPREWWERFLEAGHDHRKGEKYDTRSRARHAGPA